MSARHGPLGTVRGSVNPTAPDSPGRRVVVASVVTGPARNPPGPSVSVTVPPTSTARPPVLRTATDSAGTRSADRVAVTVPMAKSLRGAPPGPTSRYTRTPTRLTVV